MNTVNTQDGYKAKEASSDYRLCGSCMFFASRSGGSIGRCRKNAPTVKGWPDVSTEDWCGDHKRK